MSGLSDLSPVLDSALCAMLFIIIIYAIILNKKMKEVRAARAAMATLTVDLDVAVRRAEKGLAKVKAEVAESTTRMVERGEAAKRLANDLARLEERATRAGDRLERLSRVSRDEAARRRHGLAADIRDR